MAVDSSVEHVPREHTGMADAFRGIDTLVFTCGIGANAAALRALSAAWPGLVDVQVLRSSGEKVIARHTAHLFARWPRNVACPGLVAPSAQVRARAPKVFCGRDRNLSERCLTERIKRSIIVGCAARNAAKRESGHRQVGKKFFKN